jgi:putative membrane protein
MNTIAQVAATLAGLLHVAIFYMEAIAFTQPKIYRRFLVSGEAAAQAIKPWAFNQGFYNLFLAIGTLIGVVVWLSDHDDAGRALVAFGCGCMIGAALVLVGSDRRMTRAALTQGLLPLIALATMW